MCHYFFVSGEAAEDGHGDGLEHQLWTAVRTVFAAKHPGEKGVSYALKSGRGLRFAAESELGINRF